MSRFIPGVNPESNRGGSFSFFRRLPYPATGHFIVGIFDLFMRAYYLRALSRVAVNRGCASRVAIIFKIYAKKIARRCRGVQRGAGKRPPFPARGGFSNFPSANGIRDGAGTSVKNVAIAAITAPALSPLLQSNLPEN